ncbi:MAG: OmpP1/FadL family transporter [Gammaproteobacteria bacterium]
MTASRALAVAIFSLLPFTTHAGALYFPEMSSASEAGYGGAGMVARANDAGTVFSNPAGMTRFNDAEIMAGGIGVFIDADFETFPDNTAPGRSDKIDHRVVPAGSFAYLKPLSDKLSIGVSAHNYMGLALNWDDGWVGRYNAVEVALLFPQVQPTVAYKLTDWLSVGAGAALTMGYLKDKLRVESIPPGDRDGKLRLSDTDFAVQGNFGVMIEPSERTRIGIRYLTETDIDFEDSPDISGVSLPDFNPGIGLTDPAEGLDLGVTMPQQLHGAIHHQWNDKLALLGSVGWEEFSEFGKIQVGVDAINGGISTTVDADFRDVWHFGIGTEYQLNPKWLLTAGFSRDTSMSTDRTRPIVIPLGTMRRYAIGFKNERRENLTLGGGLTFIWEGNLPVKDASGASGTTVSGRYKNASIWVASFYARWH